MVLSTFSGHPIFLILLFIYGSVIGSFLNVCIFRLPEGESIIRPPSRCGSCGRQLGVIDLIPVFAALIFRFRCRYCGRRYSWQYPFVEAATGALFVGARLAFGLSLEAVAVIVIGCALIVIFFIDLRYLIIPDGLNAIILVTGFVVDGARIIGTWHDDLGRRYYEGAVRFAERIGGVDHTVYIPRSVLGMLVGAGAFLLISWAARKVFGQEAMGGGDVKLAGAMGAVLGPGYVLLSYALLSICLGAVVGVLLMALRLRSRRDYIPFGPMMAVAGIIMLFWGDGIAHVVTRLYHLP
jgi:leader peptidase (prepilin peptidase)/N-methyltransferase